MLSDHHCHIKRHQYSPGCPQLQGGLIDEGEPKDQYLQGYSTHGGCPFRNILLKTKSHSYHP